MSIIDRGGGTAKVWLAPVVVAGYAGFTARDLGAVMRLVRAHQTELMEAWHEFFDTDIG